MGKDSFIVKNNKLIVSDPCYKLPVDDSQLLLKAKNGKWLAKTINIDNKISKLIVNHINHTSINKWEYNNSVYVDSGQISIVDYKYYRDNNVIDYEPEFTFDYKDGLEKKNKEEKWYRACCDISLNDEKNNFGSIPYGIVSQSGSGDGIYDVYIKKDNRKRVIGIKVKLIKEEYII